MDNRRHSTAGKQIAVIASLLVSFAFFCGTPAEAQQASRLSTAYTKAARLALLAIETDTSTPQDDDSETIEIAVTQAIDAAAEKAVTKEEKSTTETLREIYQAKRHDNTTLRAYQVLMDVENADDPDEDSNARKEKNDAVAQFADGQAQIMKHEEPCFGQLEQSLDHRTAGDTTACSEWIQKAMRSTDLNKIAAR